MELDDEFDDLLAGIDEPTSPKQLKLDEREVILQQPGTSKDIITKPSTSKTHCVLVNQKQRGNPLLKFITSVPWEYDDIIPDYEIGKTICLLFLSVRFHNLNPDYINNRLKELGKKYELRVLLVQVDLKDPHAALKNLTRICLLTDMTLMLAWSPEEAAKIIENYKIYENKPPDRIMEKVENDPHQKPRLKAQNRVTSIFFAMQLAGRDPKSIQILICVKIYFGIINALSSIKPVNKTDAMTLITTFGTLENIIKASEARLAECPGFATTKAKKLYKALHEPFLKRGNNVTKAQSKDGEFAEDIRVEDLEKLELERERSEVQVQST